MIHVHHLRIGRAVFTVWLLEELHAPYELTFYDRDETGRAKDDLKKAHPLGKSPVIEDGDLTLAESGAITSYLIDKFDKDNTLAPPRKSVREHAIWTQWLHYPEGSAFAPLLIRMLLLRSEDPVPALIDGFARGEIALQLGYIQDAIGAKPYLLGDRFQAADIGITYIAHLAKRLGELEPYPSLSAYLARNLARPAMMRAIERTGEKLG